MSRIGLIGLGNMGIPMAANLMKAGHEVVGYRRGDPADFRALGGRVAASPRALADDCEVILCCIPDDAALVQSVTGPQGLAQGDCTGLTLVELSTLSVETKAGQAQALAEKGGVMLDGAISGLPPMVAARNATFLLSGDRAVYDGVEPILKLLTEKLFFMGEFGAAMKAKLCANMLVAANIASTAEMLVFAASIGVDQTRLIAALKDGACGSVQFTARAPKMIRGDWHNVLGSVRMLAKDIHLIEAQARAVACPVPVLSNTARIYETAIADGFGDLDSATLYAVFAAAAGIVTPNPDKETPND